MEQRIAIRAERSHTRDIILYLILIALGIWVAGMGNNAYLILAMIILWLALEFLDERFFPQTQIIEAVFLEDEVTFHKKRQKVTIKYSDIKEVEKFMVINRTYEEKGHYRIRIKAKHRSLRFYNPVAEYEKHLDFEQTEVYELYKEFRHRGVKCC